MKKRCSAYGRRINPKTIEAINQLFKRSEKWLPVTEFHKIMQNHLKKNYKKESAIVQLLKQNCEFKLIYCKSNSYKKCVNLECKTV